MADYSQLSALLGKKKQDDEVSDPQLRAGMSMDPSMGQGLLDMVLGKGGKAESMPDPTKPERGLEDTGMLNPLDYVAAAQGPKLARALLPKAVAPASAEITKALSGAASETPAATANMDKELKIKALKDTIERYNDPKNWQTMDDVLQRPAANEELVKLAPEKVMPQRLQAVPDLPPITEAKPKLMPFEFVDEDPVRDIVLPTKEQLGKTSAYPALQNILKKRMLQ